MLLDATSSLDRAETVQDDSIRRVREAGSDSSPYFEERHAIDCTSFNPQDARHSLASGMESHTQKRKLGGDPSNTTPEDFERHSNSPIVPLRSLPNHRVESMPHLSHELPLLSNVSQHGNARDDEYGDTQPNTASIKTTLHQYSQESPTQINIAVEPAVKKQVIADVSLPDTQLSSRNSIGLSNDYQDSPTQINPTNDLTSTDSFEQDDLSIDMQVNPQSVASFIADELAHSARETSSITQHFHSTKARNFGSRKEAVPVGSFDNPTTLFDVTQKSKWSEASFMHQDPEVDSIHRESNDSSVLGDNNLPGTQEVCSVELGDLPRDVGPSSPQYMTALHIEKQPLFNPIYGHGPSQTPMVEDGDLPDTQSGRSAIPHDQALSHDSAMRYEDSQATQATQGDTDVAFSPLGSLPALNEMQSKNKDQQVRKDPEVVVQPGLSASANSVKPGEKAPLNKLTCRERKRIATSYNRPPSLTKAMKQWVTKTHNLLDPFREDDDCWFHPSPPPARFTASGVLRPCGKLQKCFTWQDHRGKHSLVLNYGMVSKIVNFKLTKQQKDGFINKQWHLSHLCGNWTCLNPRHTTVEPGKINISRNNCFSHRSGCLHDPKCLKEKKVPLAPDGKPIDHDASTGQGASQKPVEDWDEWAMHSFDDGEVSVLIDDQDETEFAMNGEDEDETEVEVLSS
ncbi:uncharacterized protein LY89DRAFT_146082 [Mollisia scopiformis]|uniref:Zinc-binding loop region of homing endonuclease domain-containing protein n=1 Tax=Mollisia scopiformis TaxID=149040 RepID=A0A194X169_MOLSC|nr:uncharacterized protein LY89DRAFT_146082 [Mollisia scopiformis]KUJ13719.1 hypothetical protein LY89DRAFT_146082 [Mollisia scopiformis]